MISLNQVILIGFLGSNPEIKQGENGDFAILNLATNESYVNKEENWKAKMTEWHEVVVFVPALVELAKKLNSRDMVFVEGALRTKKWIDPVSTKPRTKVQVVISSPRHLLRFQSLQDSENQNSSREPALEGQGAE